MYLLHFEVLFQCGDKIVRLLSVIYSMRNKSNEADQTGIQILSSPISNIVKNRRQFFSDELKKLVSMAYI